ncbi:hypothetical protein MJO28_009681 [Puccinia striiformis f. sp. tritici]|uniref:Uncharacterized protein n=1 Tax=Puccinia striiformis f. sp. tritici TaxID=168172 RepID=A0ACC0E8L3_9BASI|nr:hypothetical protein MJO28_009681 [Puccinia striiformis f. sp. tritici]
MPPKKTSTTPSTKKKSIPWDRDGINDGPSSIQIVLSWISADDNYERVRQKIGELQSSYNTARDFLKNTGEGILAEDEVNGVHTVEAKLLELCRYYNTLDPIMGARSVTQPLHVRSSVNGDQPGRPDSPGSDDDPPEAPHMVLDVQDIPSDSSELPNMAFRFVPAPAPATASSTQKKKPMNLSAR